MKWRNFTQIATYFWARQACGSWVYKLLPAEKSEARRPAIKAHDSSRNTDQVKGKPCQIETLPLLYEFFKEKGEVE